MHSWTSRESILECNTHARTHISTQTFNKYSCQSYLIILSDTNCLTKTLIEGNLSNLNRKKCSSFNVIQSYT